MIYFYVFVAIIVFSLFLMGLPRDKWGGVWRRDIGVMFFDLSLIMALIGVLFVPGFLHLLPQFLEDELSTVQLFKVVYFGIANGWFMEMVRDDGIKILLSFLSRAVLLWVLFPSLKHMIFKGATQSLNIPALFGTNRWRGQKADGPRWKLPRIYWLPFVPRFYLDLEVILRHDGSIGRAAKALEDGGFNDAQSKAVLTTAMVPTNGSIIGTTITDSDGSAGGVQAAVRTDFNFKLVNADQFEALSAGIRKAIIGTIKNEYESNWRDWATILPYSVLRKIIGQALLWVSTAKVREQLQKFKIESAAAAENVRNGVPGAAMPTPVDFWNSLMGLRVSVGGEEMTIDDARLKFEKLIADRQYVKAIAMVDAWDADSVITRAYRNYGYLVTRIGIEDFVEETAVEDARARLAKAELEHAISIAAGKAQAAEFMELAAVLRGRITHVGMGDDELVATGVFANQIREQKLSVEAAKSMVAMIGQGANVFEAMKAILPKSAA